MSYLVSVVIEKPIDENNVPYLLMGGFDGMIWHMEKNSKKISAINKKVIKALKKPDGVTTIEKLKTAPLDEVIVVYDDSYHSMKDRIPIDNSGRHKPTVDIQDYLKP